MMLCNLRTEHPRDSRKVWNILARGAGEDGGRRDGVSNCFPREMCSCLARTTEGLNDHSRLVTNTKVANRRFELDQEGMGWVVLEISKENCGG